MSWCILWNIKRDMLKSNKTGKDIILEIDYQGAFSVKKLFPEAISIFIFPHQLML